MWELRYFGDRHGELSSSLLPSFSILLQQPGNNELLRCVLMTSIAFFFARFHLMTRIENVELAGQWAISRYLLPSAGATFPFK
ncbi:hypothetical protein COLO4_08168 [Corchorus olitorius]|uniref:Uncharacterized protein n=1 Tax=Corchorus olitorius TaxID=93759 RepID=A0A1R3KH05_9ROSI|nr:hypothetical protein COLO4_08168 [Corchorus olitorius]